MKEYFKEISPKKVFIRTLTHKDFGGYFKIVYTNQEGTEEKTVSVSYLEFITWLFNNYISPDKFYINLN